LEALLPDDYLCVLIVEKMEFWLKAKGLIWELEEDCAPFVVINIRI